MADENEKTINNRKGSMILKIASVIRREKWIFQALNS